MSATKKEINELRVKAFNELHPIYTHVLVVEDDGKTTRTYTNSFAKLFNAINSVPVIELQDRVGYYELSNVFPIKEGT